MSDLEPKSFSTHIGADFEFPDDFEIREKLLKKLQERLEQAPVDLRAALKDFTPSADQDQERVITSTAKTIRVVAPAGSGKTQTLVNRLLHLVASRGLRADRILFLTFDNAAASAIRAKLQEIVLQAAIGNIDVRISTLNAFGYDLLRTYMPQEYKKIVPKYFASKLFRDVKQRLAERSPDRAKLLPKNVRDSFYLDFFSFLKNQLFDPRNFEPQVFANFFIDSYQANPFLIPVKEDPAALKLVIQGVAWLFQAYDRTLHDHNVMDFDDQKLRAYVDLTESTQTRNIAHGLFSEIIVDEFQDINKLDFAFIKLLAEKTNLVVTGDDDQAIYGFRGCTPDFMIYLEDNLSRTVTCFELHTNYRNPSNVIGHAMRLIEHNKNRIAKAPLAHNENKSHIKIVSSLTASLEAKAILSFFNKVKKANSSLSYKDFAILYRTNAQSLPLQIEMILNNIPYYVRDQDNILANETLEKLLGVLRIKLALENDRQPSVEDQLLTVQAYFRYVNAAAAHRLRKLFAKGDEYLEIISSKSFYEILPKAEKSHFLEAVSEVLNSKSLLDTFGILSKRFAGLGGMVGSLEDVLEDRVPLGEIFDVAMAFRGNAEHFVEAMERAIKQAKASQAGKARDNGIALLTYFKAKGLQWHTIALTTCNEGLIPHSRAPIEDERRLFYVAMTRASSNLYISYVKKSCGNSLSASRFLSEAGLIRK